MVGALPAVKPGGTIVIAAECSEGVGSPDFARALEETEDLEEFVRHISQPEVFIPEEWEVEELAKAARHASHHLRRRRHSATRRSLAVSSHLRATVEDGLRMALEPAWERCDTAGDSTRSIRYPVRRSRIDIDESG